VGTAVFSSWKRLPIRRSTRTIVGEAAFITAVMLVFRIPARPGIGYALGPHSIPLPVVADALLNLMCSGRVSDAVIWRVPSIEVLQGRLGVAILQAHDRDGRLNIPSASSQESAFTSRGNYDD
jgi:hypothetical protein